MARGALPDAFGGDVAIGRPALVFNRVSGWEKRYGSPAVELEAGTGFGRSVASGGEGDGAERGADGPWAGDAGDQKGRGCTARRLANLAGRYGRAADGDDRPGR